MMVSLGNCCGVITARARLQHGMQVGLQLLLEGFEVLPMAASFTLSNLEIMLSRHPVRRQLHGSTSGTDRLMHSVKLCVAACLRALLNSKRFDTADLTRKLAEASTCTEIMLVPVFGVNKESSCEDEANRLLCHHNGSAASCAT